ncbi:MAG: Crp/Fnr family transcriptional regulator [Thermoleophilaceae bacterium]|nr:Crp/Fnr family transcriptional regulator [Thermoleophilaceae bacterium]
MVDTATLLKALDLFKNLNEREMAELVAVAVPRAFDKGEVIFQEGQFGEVLYIVREGRVLIKREHSGGRTIAIAELNEGSLFGELAVFDGEVRSATVECVEPTQVVALTAPDVRRVLKRNPDIALKVIAALSRKLRDSTSRIGDQYFQSTEGRIVTVVLDLAQSQAGHVLPGVKVRATQAQIAQLASTSRETVSRFLANCQRSNLLTTYRGRLEISDPEGLRRMII